MNIRNMLRQAHRQEQDALSRDIVVPVIRHQSIVALRIGGMRQTMPIDHPRIGWWSSRCTASRTLALHSEAEAWQREEYLALYPSVRLVLIEQRDSYWLATPFNAAEAANRLQLPQLIAVHLVEQAAALDRVVARCANPRVLWFDDIDRRADPDVASNLRDALAGDADPCLSGLAASEKMAWQVCIARQQAERETAKENELRQSQMDAAQRVLSERSQREASIQTRIGGHLQAAGASLVAYNSSSDGVRVTWRSNGREHTALFQEDMGVVAAGICVAGYDRKLDLATLVGIVDGAPEYARSGSYAIDNDVEYED